MLSIPDIIADNYEDFFFLVGNLKRFHETTICFDINFHHP